MIKKNCEMFFASLRKKHTKRAYLGAFNEFFDFLAKTYKCRSYKNLTDATIRDAYNYYDFISSKRGIVNRNNRADTLAGSGTLVLKIKALTRLYDALMESGDVKRNIFRTNFIVLPQKEERMKRKTEAVPMSIIKKLMREKTRTLKEQQAITLSIIMYASGIRRSEAVNLKMRDVKIDGEKTLYLYLSETKSAKPQIQHLPMWAAPFISRQVTQRSLEGATNDDAFFVTYSKTGKVLGAMSDKTLYRIIVALFKKFGLKNKTPHSLRKTMINSLVDKNVHIEKIRRASRHKSIASTQKYFNDADEMSRETADLVDFEE